MKIAIVGTGMIVQIVAPHLAEWGWEVSAVCGTPRTPDQTRELTSKLGGTPYDVFADMLADTALDADAVYIAVPNFLHHDFTIQALEAGYNVICEKPFASNAYETQEMVDVAKKSGKFLFEAITTIHQPNFAKIRELLPSIGDVKMVSVNYSQYSHRYDAFRAGTVLPAFDPAKAGGAMMDLGLYNTQWIVGLFGEPKSVRYLANVERGIDTSGVETLDYGSFKAVSVIAKDCAAPTTNVIQGTKGYLIQHTPTNNCGAVTLHLNDGTEETFDENPELQWESEFRLFAEQVASGDTTECYQTLDHSALVSRVMTAARKDAGVVFPADEQ